MKKIFLSLFIVLGLTNVSIANQWVVIPQNKPPIVVMEPPIIPPPVPKPLTKTIEWVLTPQVNNVVVAEIHRGLFGRQYIVNRNELVTTWVYVPVEVWE
jgi:hypothetical protein